MGYFFLCFFTCLCGPLPLSIYIMARTADFLSSFLKKGLKFFFVILLNFAWLLVVILFFQIHPVILVVYWVICLITIIYNILNYRIKKDRERTTKELPQVILQRLLDCEDEVIKKYGDTLKYSAQKLFDYLMDIKEDSYWYQQNVELGPFYYTLNEKMWRTGKFYFVVLHFYKTEDKPMQEFYLWQEDGKTIVTDQTPWDIINIYLPIF